MRRIGFSVLIRYCISEVEDDSRVCELDLHSSTSKLGQREAGQAEGGSRLDWAERKKKEGMSRKNELLVQNKRVKCRHPKLFLPVATHEYFFYISISIPT